MRGQPEYHKENADIHGSLERRLHWYGQIVLAGTLVAAVVVLFVGFSFPVFEIFAALAAGFAAVRRKTELGRLVKRSSAMAAALESIEKQLAGVAIQVDRQSGRTTSMSTASSGR